MTRDEARKHWAASGLTYAALTAESLERLRARIDAEMIASGLIDHTYRARESATLHEQPGNRWADIRCSAYYFEDRQAVTFEPTGFVGFAGWADEENVQPILAAFVDWVDELLQKHLPLEDVADA
jgi:hypothetical protein